LKRTLFATFVLSALMAVSMPGIAVAKDGGKSPIAKYCQENHVSAGFKSVGQCVRAGGGSTGDADLRLADGVWPCSGQDGCIVAVYGEGLRPGSEVIVGEPAFQFGAPYPVGASGSLTVEGIFQIGVCTTRPTVDFIARGEAPGGGLVESDILTVSMLDYMPACP
jgi:hypothetical protein